MPKAVVGFAHDVPLLVAVLVYLLQLFAARLLTQIVDGALQPIAVPDPHVAFDAMRGVDQSSRNHKIIQAAPLWVPLGLGA